jgi:Flp pilus assembly protein TadG
MARLGSERGGSSLLEFTLVGIPMMFVLISTFELARGMWTYHTLASAVKTGTRYAARHGLNCSLNGNTCTVTIQQIAANIQAAAPGLFADQMTLTFTPASGSTTNCVLSTCQSDSTYAVTWPPAGSNAPGVDVSISGTYPFNSIISMFWPGTGGPTRVTSVTFGTSSKERVQF